MTDFRRFCENAACSFHGVIVTVETDSCIGCSRPLKVEVVGSFVDTITKIQDLLARSGRPERERP